MQFLFRGEKVASPSGEERTRKLNRMRLLRSQELDDLNRVTVGRKVMVIMSLKVTVNCL